MNHDITRTVGKIVKNKLKNMMLYPKFIEIPISR